MTRTTRLASFLLLATAAAAACSKKPPAVAPAPVPPPVNQDSIDAARARADSIARADQARRDSIAAADRAHAAAAAQARTTITQQVYFAYDSDKLSDSATAALDAKIPILNANSGLQVRIAGNTDERGSDEYNLALGQRRAAAAKRYLTDHGVSGSRLTLISYGEERPVAQGHDESAYRLNRRDEFEITAGGDQLVAPSAQ